MDLYEIIVLSSLINLLSNEDINQSLQTLCDCYAILKTKTVVVVKKKKIRRHKIILGVIITKYKILNPMTVLYFIRNTF